MNASRRPEDKDWDTLNALVDGRLSSEAQAVVKRRLESEQSLANDFAELGSLKARLSSMRAVERTSVSSPWPLRFASGACAAAVILFISLLEPAPSASDAHARFVARVDAPAAAELWRRPATNAFDHLDFSTFGLKPIQTLRYGDDQIVHYVGARGCRITLIAGPSAQAAANAEEQGAFWTSHGAPIALIAQGMDPTRLNRLRAYAGDPAAAGGDRRFAGGASVPCA